MCLVKGFNTLINICCVKFLNSVAWPLRLASISTHINDLSRQETIRFLLTHKSSLGGGFSVIFITTYYFTWTTSNNTNKKFNNKILCLMLKRNIENGSQLHYNSCIYIWTSTGKFTLQHPTQYSVCSMHIDIDTHIMP